MKNKLFYLSGGMQSFGSGKFFEANGWRVDMKNNIEDLTNRKVLCFNPNDHWSFVDKDLDSFTNREIMNYDLSKLRTSDLVIVNFNDPKSLGTMSEMAIAYELHIPIIGINKDGYDLHPWQIEFCEHIFSNTQEATQYIANHYINDD